MKYVVIDVETTGLSPTRGDRIIEVSALALEGNTVTDEFCTLVNAGYPIAPQAHKINGITQAMLKDSPAPPDVFPALHGFIKGAILVAHNVRFDLMFLWHEFQRLGLSLPNRHRCTFKLSRERYPHLANHRLDTVYQYLFGAIDEKTKRHRARDDAQMTARIWLRMTRNEQFRR